MFFFKKKKSETTDLGWLGTDIHSHLVPGIDDGAQDMQESLALVKGLKELGYSRLVTTPHILWEMYPNTPQVIHTGLDSLQQAVQQQGLGVTISAAAEYFIDEHFEQSLKAKQPLLQLKDNLVLVEISMVTAPFDLQEVLFEMQLQGYQPVVAHPERYIYLRHRKEFFDELKNAGCLLQLNLLSLTGHYGPTVQELAAYLVKKEAYDYAGTDLHNSRHLQALQKLSAAPLYQQLKESGQVKNHLL